VQITHAYTDLAGTRNERTERLRKYFFECECKRCLDYKSDPVECTVAGLRCADALCGGSPGWDRESGQRRSKRETSHSEIMKEKSHSESMKEKSHSESMKEKSHSESMNEKIQNGDTIAVVRHHRESRDNNGNFSLRNGIKENE
jgi:hypothetical protein